MKAMKLAILGFLFLVKMHGSYAQLAQTTLHHPCQLRYIDAEMKRLFLNHQKTKVFEYIPQIHLKKNIFKEPTEIEANDQAYLFYEAYDKNDLKIGYLTASYFKTTAKNEWGELFVAYNKQDQIIDFYIQKMPDADVEYFRSKYYRKQFKKLNLQSSFEDHEFLPPQRLPSEKQLQNHFKLLNAIRRNQFLTQELYKKMRE